MQTGDSNESQDSGPAEDPKPKDSGLAEDPQQTAKQEGEDYEPMISQGNNQ